MQRLCALVMPRLVADALCVLLLLLLLQLVESVFPALTGGWFTMFMAVFSYVADVTDKDSRTLRIGIVNVFCSLGIPIGMALSGVLYKRIGYAILVRPTHFQLYA